jgi:hypothetical protein
MPQGIYKFISIGTKHISLIIHFDLAEVKMTKIPFNNFFLKVILTFPPLVEAKTENPFPPMSLPWATAKHRVQVELDIVNLI